jgi:transaldolase
MKVFVDTADVADVRAAKALGMADGVTTNPTLIKKSGRDFREVIVEIASEIDGPVNAEVVSIDSKGIVEEGRQLASWAPNIAVKIPITAEGLRAVKVLESEGIQTTVTLIFSPTQALLAAKAGASYICPFVGRLDDIATDGMGLIDEIVGIYSNYSGLRTQVIVASIRDPIHVVEAGHIGADGVTVPFKVIEQLSRHPLTDIGIQRFLDDWKRVAS